ncbi:MAG TPA: DUF2336 domain-containing protein [Rhizomicrobium sp.]|nr:DUF2336 domain-containing protein [Rhizomicrobium sp.]
MSASGQKSRFARLLDVKSDMSSENRRALLREVTDVFAEHEQDGDAAKVAKLDQVLSSVVAEFSREVRAELAAKIGPSKVGLGATVEKLALDDIEIARPILEQSALSEAHLLQVISQKTQEHLLAVTRRSDITETVSHALVEKGDDRVVVSLLENARAKIAPKTYETVTELAQSRPVLYAPFVRRQDVPLELLNDVYLEVEGELRREILARYDQVSPAELDAALERSRAKLLKAHRKPALEAAKIKARIEEFRSKGEFNPPILIRLLREGDASRGLFVGVFATLTDVEESLAEKVVDSGDIDALALLCRAADFERAVFVSLAIALIGSERRMTKVEEFGALYENVPVSAAQRAVRFWKVRTSSAAA